MESSILFAIISMLVGVLIGIGSFYLKNVSSDLKKIREETIPDLNVRIARLEASIERLKEKCEGKTSPPRETTELQRLVADEVDSRTRELAGQLKSLFDGGGSGISRGSAASLPMKDLKERLYYDKSLLNLNQINFPTKPPSEGQENG